MEVHHPVCILALGSGQSLLYRLGLGLVLRFCAYSYGGVYNRNTAGGELQQERRVRVRVSVSFSVTLLRILFCMCPKDT